MPSHVRKRHFTLEEAAALVPRLRQRVERMMQLSAHLRASSDGSEALSPPGAPWLGDPVIAAWESSDPEKSRVFAAALYETLSDEQRRVESLGVQVKDLGIGLLGFPSFLEGGTEVQLSWCLQENTIGYFCPLAGGLRTRQPIAGHTFLDRRARTGQLRE